MEFVLGWIFLVALLKGVQCDMQLAESGRDLVKPGGVPNTHLCGLWIHLQYQQQGLSLPGSREGAAVGRIY
ncbi:Hypothetical predicted protein [Lynx pardinus]|uniref:Uncharacterized protein n=1 Tax=Lynx pardinus TaxID=191816 RepID=A0A485NIW4_LYNPA|nr:Hypothetical predicted protein [Lynx pardinus]